MAVEEANGVSEAAIEEASRLWDAFVGKPRRVTVRVLNEKEDEVSISLSGGRHFSTPVSRENVRVTTIL